MDLSRLNRDAMAETKLQMNAVKEDVFRQEYEALSAAMDAKAKRFLLAVREKGA
jgi:hypothetical protein